MTQAQWTFRRAYLLRQAEALILEELAERVTAILRRVSKGEAA